MMNFLSFFLGTLFGGTVGIFLMCLFTVGAKTEEREEKKIKR